jgi:hypothetical protein
MLLLDNSAWARLSSRSLPDERRVKIADPWCAALRADQPASSRTGPQLQQVSEDLVVIERGEVAVFPRVRIDSAVEDAALRAQHELV